MASNLTTRIGIAAVLIPAAVGVLWLGSWPLAATLAALGVLGARELFDLARKQGIEPLAELGYGSAAAIPLATYAAHRADQAWGAAGWYAGVVWLLALLGAALYSRGPKRRPLAAVAVTTFGTLYAAAPLAFLIAIRHGLNSELKPLAYLLLAVFPLALTWICDTAAYSAGAQFGGPKMAPVVSPRKTWAGAVGGLAAALVFAVALGLLVLNRCGWQFDVWQLLGIGLVVGVLGQVGDLAESLLKREAGVKDSSDLIPGHGGVLDRLDSLYFVIPATAALLLLYGVI
ncbi:MAG: phosphatidate cytidylyltransferase [Gemmatimonadales bacterium]